MPIVSRKTTKTALIFWKPPHSPWTAGLNLVQIRRTSYGKRWTPKEDEVLTDLRSVGKPWEEIRAQFPKRTLTAVKERWNKITPRSEDGRLLKYWGPKQLRYSAEDDQKLIRLVKPGRHPGKYDEIMPNLPERGYNAVVSYYRRALQPGMRDWVVTKKQQRWTEEEITRTLELRNVHRLEYNEIAAQLGRSAESVRTRYSKAMRSLQDRPEYPSADRFFTPDDDATIVQLRKQGRSTKEIAAHFPRRTFRSIQLRAWLLREQTGARRWRSAAERAVLEERLIGLRDGGISWEEIAREFPGTPLTTLETYLSKARRKRKALKPSSR